MMRFDFAASGTFGDLWLFSDEGKRLPLKRDFRPAIVAAYACPYCGAERGQPCTRPTLIGRLERRLPHVGRGKPGRNDPREGR